MAGNFGGFADDQRSEPELHHYSPSSNTIHHHLHPLLWPKKEKACDSLDSAWFGFDSSRVFIKKVRVSNSTIANLTLYELSLVLVQKCDFTMFSSQYIMFHTWSGSKPRCESGYLSRKIIMERARISCEIASKPTINKKEFGTKIGQDLSILYDTNLDHVVECEKVNTILSPSKNSSMFEAVDE
ncbi:hypothetical protein LguiB_025250 [Lonicera macranthoides]